MGIGQSCEGSTLKERVAQDSDTQLELVQQDIELKTRKGELGTGDEGKVDVERKIEEKEGSDVRSPPASLAIPEISVGKFSFYCLLTAIVGVLVSFQIQLNNQASQHAGINTYGTLLSFMSSTVVLTAAVYLLAEPNSEILKFESFHWWCVMPGIMGVIFVTGTTVVSIYIGVALMWIPVVVGQMISSVVVDSVYMNIDVTHMKVLSILLVIVGAFLSVFARIDSGDQSIIVVILCVIFALLVGAMSPVQALLNRKTSVLLPSRLQTTWWNFLIGDIFAAVCFLVEACIAPDESKQFLARLVNAPVLTYFGGLLGALFIASTITITGIIGSAPFFLCLVCGQIVGSVFIEEVGILGATQNSPGTLRIVGMTLVIVSAALLPIKDKFLHMIYTCKKRNSDDSEEDLDVSFHDIIIELSQHGDENDIDSSIHMMNI